MSDELVVLRVESEETKARIERIRGKLHPFETIAPEKTALVVVDLQNVFMAEESFYGVAAAREIVPAVNRLATALRQRGGSQLEAAELSAAMRERMHGGRS